MDQNITFMQFWAMFQGQSLAMCGKTPNWLNEPIFVLSREIMGNIYIHMLRVQTEWTDECSKRLWGQHILNFRLNKPMCVSRYNVPYPYVQKPILVCTVPMAIHLWRTRRGTVCTTQWSLYSRHPLVQILWSYHNQDLREQFKYL